MITALRRSHMAMESAELELSPAGRRANAVHHGNPRLSDGQLVPPDVPSGHARPPAYVTRRCRARHDQVS
jgi:hypothetical protein